MSFLPHYSQRSRTGIVYKVVNFVRRQLRAVEQCLLASLHRGQRPKRLADHLLTIRQGEKETLRSYVKRFTQETLEVDEADDKV